MNENRIAEANGEVAIPHPAVGALTQRRAEHIAANGTENKRLAEVERTIRTLRAERRTLREMAAARSAAVGEINLILKEIAKP